jgi:hypothetical protein
VTVRRSVAGRDAPALRFLLLCVGGWTVLRVTAHWNPAVPPPPIDAPPWSVPAPFATIGPTEGDADVLAAPVRRLATIPSRSEDTRSNALAAAWMEPATAVAVADNAALSGIGNMVDRHGLRLALMAHRLPAPLGGAARSAIRASSPAWAPLPPAERAEPGQGKPFWMRRQLAGWSLAGWLYMRGGAVAAPDAIAAAGQLGGSQAGLRLGYGFGEAGRARTYGRATIALRRPEQRDLAFGLAFAPVAHWPVDVAVEQRVAVGREGRTAIAAMVSGGVSDIALPHGFRLDAYGQAGVVGTRRRDGFADGAIVIDRWIGPDETSPLRLGALAAGAVQPGAARVDVGPRLTLRLPQVGEGSRIALDWRQRVAGGAAPESGVALTLASDF